MHCQGKCCGNCICFSFSIQEKKISQTFISFADQSLSFILWLPVHLGQHRAGPEKVQVKEKAPGGWAARWITGSCFVCSFRPLRNCAGLKQWLSYGAASHLPHLQPVMNDGSRGQQTLGAQPLNTLSKMAKGHVLQQHSKYFLLLYSRQIPSSLLAPSEAFGSQLRACASFTFAKQTRKKASVLFLRPFNCKHSHRNGKSVLSVLKSYAFINM